MVLTATEVITAPRRPFKRPFSTPLSQGSAALGSAADPGLCVLRTLARCSWPSTPMLSFVMEKVGKSLPSGGSTHRRTRARMRGSRGGHDVFLDAADASDRLRRDPQRLPLFGRLILGDPEMN